MTPKVVLRLIEDVIGAGAPAVTLADSCNRSFYAVEGEATVLDAHGSRALAADRALRFEGPVTVTAGPGGARLWRFEIVPAPAADDGRLAAGFDIGARADPHQFGGFFQVPGQQVLNQSASGQVSDESVHRHCPSVRR